MEDKTKMFELGSTKEIAIDMPQGYFLSWFCTTQAMFDIHVTLKDECQTYFSGHKASTDIKPPLSMGAEVQRGKNLKLVIDIPCSVKIRMETNKNIIEIDGVEVARNYAWFIEDQDDDDFNDMHLSLIGWKHRG